MADFIEPLYKKGKYLYPYTQLNFTSLLQQNGIFETLRTKFRHFETLYRMFWHDPHTKIDFHSLSMLLNGTNHWKCDGVIRFRWGPGFFYHFFAAWRSVLGQNLLKIRNFHKIRGDLFLIKSRKNLKLKMGLLGFLGDVCGIF